MSLFNAGYSLSRRRQSLASFLCVSTSFSQNPLLSFLFGSTRKSRKDRCSSRTGSYVLIVADEPPKGAPDSDAKKKNGRLKIERLSQNFWYATGAPIYQVEIDRSQLIFRTSTHLEVYDIGWRTGENEAKARWKERLFWHSERIYCLTDDFILLHRVLACNTVGIFTLLKRRGGGKRRVFSLPEDGSLKNPLSIEILWPTKLSITEPLRSKSGVIVIKRDKYTFYAFDISCDKVRVKIWRSSREILEPVLFRGEWDKMEFRAIGQPTLGPSRPLTNRL